MMKIIGFILMLVTLLVLQAEEYKRGNIAKRIIGLWRFHEMIQCATGRRPLDYNGYGCYCGFGGKGRIVDGTDRCCFQHDKCYGRAVSNRICLNYAWTFTNYKRVGCNGCDVSNTGCARQLCYCDRIASNCFRRNRFNPRFQNFNKRWC